MSTTQQMVTQLPPGPRPLPIFGNLLSFRNNQLDYLQQLQQRYGNMATFYAGKTPIMLFFRPEQIRYLFTENPRNFTNREIAGNLQELIGDGLLTIDGETHRQQRRMVQPAFHKKRVEGYADIMVKHTLEMLETWHDGERMDIAQTMQELTLRIVAKCLFNVDLSAEVGNLGSSFTAMIANPVSLTEAFLGVRIDRPFTSYGRRMAAKRTLDTFIYKLIEQRRAEKQDVGDVLSMLLTTHDEEQSLTNTQVRDHIMTFVAAGHETTSLTLMWTFYLLSQHTIVYEKLLNEVQTILGDNAPTVDTIGNLPYLEWVLNESMRLYPPAWSQGRRAIEAFDLDGYHFPAGTMVMFSQWVMHRLPDIWEAPTEFRPERWDPVSGQKVPQWAYFPFGGGPRMCIGMPFAQMEAKLLLATILQHFRLQLVSDYHLQLSPLITLRPKHGMPMIVRTASRTVERERSIEANAG
jgi:cytochrome P450